MQLIFDRSILSFLKAEGYTYIYHVGIIADTEHYLITPLRKDDPRLSYTELDKIIEEIDSDELLDMADGDEFITFYIDIPVSSFIKFKQIH